MRREIKGEGINQEIKTKTKRGSFPGDFYDFKLVDGRNNLISSTEFVGNPLTFDLSINPIIIDCCASEQWYTIYAKLSDSADGRASNLSLYSASDIEIFGELTSLPINISPATTLPTTGYSHRFTKRSDGSWQKYLLKSIFLGNSYFLYR